MTWLLFSDWGRYLCCPDANPKPWRRAAVKQSEKRQLLALGWSTERRDNALALHKKALLTLVMITVRNIFLWGHCLGGWATWHKHRFGCVWICTFFSSSSFYSTNAHLCKSLILHVQRQWRNIVDHFWCGATSFVRFASWLKMLLLRISFDTE